MGSVCITLAVLFLLLHNFQGLLGATDFSTSFQMVLFNFTCYERNYYHYCVRIFDAMFTVEFQLRVLFALIIVVVACFIYKSALVCAYLFSSIRKLLSTCRFTSCFTIHT